MQRITKIIGAAVIAGAFVVGGYGTAIALSFDKPEPAPTQTPTPTPAPTTETPTPTPEPSTRTVTIDELKDAAVAAGFECPGWSVNTAPEPNDSWLVEGTCENEDTIRIYGDAENWKTDVEVFSDYDAETPWTVVSDNDWMLLIEDPTQAALVGAALGGTVATNPYPTVDDTATEEPVEQESTEEPKSDLSTSQQEAIESAESYIDSGSFSKSGLVDQLKYEKFSTKEAKYAVEHIDVDWTAEADDSAASYMDSGSFSHGTLTDQLLYEGFSKKQTKHAVKSVGL